MSTLLLRLAAPLQAWGLESKFERRGTMREPTKSGVVGLLAAALGRGRDESVADLAQLRYGVRIDQPGKLLRDYHVARGEKTAIYVTERYYLADAVFLAGFEGDEELLNELDCALKNPAYPLYLGRRSCPPEGQITLGLRGLPLEQALIAEEWKAGNWLKLHAPDSVSLTLVVDADKPGMLRRRDYPVSFSRKRREFTFRYVEDRVNLVQYKDTITPDSYSTDHDPFTELGG